MRINEILRKENLGKVYQIAGYVQKSEYIVKEYNGHVYLESRENFKKIEENFFLVDILGMSFEEVFYMTERTLKEIIDSYRNKDDKENETVDKLIEKQIKKRIKESDLIFKYFGRF